MLVQMEHGSQSGWNAKEHEELAVLSPVKTLLARFHGHSGLGGQMTDGHWGVEWEVCTVRAGLDRGELG